MGDTGIQWTDKVWNCVVGCNQVSPGCDHCYAKTLHDKRHKAFLAGKKMAPQYAEPFETVQLKPGRLADPLSWRKPRRVFVNSVSDLFHADVPTDYLAQVFAVMAVARRHTFQVLTKRAGRMRSLMSDPDFAVEVLKYVRDLQQDRDIRWIDWPLPNVWLGVSVENRATLPRLHALRQTRAAVRFVSFEPLLEHIEPDLTGIQWAIIGGESGKDARYFGLDWARVIIDRCGVFGTTPFMKQLGSNAFDSSLTESGRNETIRTRDSHGGDMAEWPEDLRVREFPAGANADA